MSSETSETASPSVREGQGSTKLSREEFERRYQEQFHDPAFDAARTEIARLTGERPEPTFLVTKRFNPDMVKALISQALFFDEGSRAAA